MVQARHPIRRYGRGTLRVLPNQRHRRVPPSPPLLDAGDVQAPQPAWGARNGV
jgi:hypothetical protein